MKQIISFTIFFSICQLTFGQLSSKNIQHSGSLQNTNHPEIAYWFIDKSMLKEATFKLKIDSLSSFSKYTLIFLTARNGVDFYDIERMHPILKNLVIYAHSKGLKIGLQLWQSPNKTSEQHCDRVIVENEILLTDTSNIVTNVAKHVRAQSGKPFKSALLKVYAFKKMGDGLYEQNSFQDITNKCIVIETTESSVKISIKPGILLAGYTAYILSQHFYKVSSNYSDEAADKFTNIMKAYGDIPFDGVGLDEYTNLKLFAVWELQKLRDTLNERLYSIDMALKYHQLYNCDLERTLFDMRYAPIGHPEIRIKAINTYMDVMRSATLNVETKVYDSAKRIFGDSVFVGLHETHHNQLNGDEVWQTGINWWNVKRDYGQTDERTPLPTQMGIAYGYKKNMLYNMFYDKSIDTIQKKAFEDLRYNIRTHYHAINDVQNWGFSVERPEALTKINVVENCARLLNKFNPPPPEIKLLIVFGREALMNWYPYKQNKGICSINDKLAIEEKAMGVWNAGYLNALVPTDVIEDERLKLNTQGKAVYNGHVFDAVIFLYPQFAKEKTLTFLEEYEAKGGKLMVEGDAKWDFYGDDLSLRWKNIVSHATAQLFDLTKLSALGLSINNQKNSVKTTDGSWIFGSYNEFITPGQSTFTKNMDGSQFEGVYKGYAALKVNRNTISKFAATAFSKLTVNHKVVLELNKPADIFLLKTTGAYKLQIANSDAKVIINNL